MYLFELKADNICNKCQNETSCTQCKCFLNNSENINTGNMGDCYSIYSNICDFRYLQPEHQQRQTKVQGKENIGSYYNAVSNNTVKDNRIIAVPYFNLMTEYNTAKSKRYR